jgi:hypothetical protein
MAVNDRAYCCLCARELVMDHRRPSPGIATTGGIAAIVGKWPGDETDEQIAAALADLS